MANEIPGAEASGDNTTAAIYDLIRTMGADAGPAQGGQRTPLDVTGINRAAEQVLIEAGVFINLSPARRQALGCMACLWSQNPEDPTFYPQQISDCGDRSRSNAWHALKGLTDAGVITRRRAPATDVGEPKVLYSPADTPLGRLLLQNLRKPAHCGLEQASRTNLNTSAENYLIEQGAASDRSDLRREVLGCLACHLAREKPLHASTIANCHGFDNERAARKALTSLTSTGVLESYRPPKQSGRRGPRPIAYQPTETPLSQGLAQRLEAPEVCGLAEDEDRQ